jgi:hypothetical protein
MRPPVPTDQLALGSVEMVVLGMALKQLNHPADIPTVWATLYWNETKLGQLYNWSEIIAHGAWRPGQIDFGISTAGSGS